MSTDGEDTSQETNPPTPLPDPENLEVILEAERFIKTLEILDAISYESILLFGANGIDVRLVDPGNVTMTDLDLETGAFEHYGNGSYPAGVSHEELLDLLKLADSNGLVQLAFDAETRKLHVEFGRIERDFALIDPESIRRRPDIPAIYDSLPNTIEIPAEYIKEAVKNAQLVSDHIYIEADMHEEAVSFWADGDTDDTYYTFRDDDYEHADIREGATSIVSLDWMEDLVKVIPKEATVEVTFGEEKPVFLKWRYADGNGTVTQTLAPRITSDR